MSRFVAAHASSPQAAREGAFHGKRSLSPRARKLGATLALAPIRFYQRFISPALPRRCKYEPTCSAYAVDAIKEVGLLRGVSLALWRLLRCNPLSNGGLDPVSERRLFRRCDEDYAS